MRTRSSLCGKGHDMDDPANVYVIPSSGQRQCRPCRVERARAYKAANAERLRAYEHANKEAIAERRAAYRRNNAEKVAEGKRAYYAANKKAHTERTRAYYQANREAVAEQTRAYRRANKEAVAERKRAYYAANKEVINERTRAYYAANKKDLGARQRAYQRANPEKCHADRQRRRARVAGVLSEPYTQQDIIDRDGLDCYLCGLSIDLTISRRDPRGATTEHVVPISKGGHDTLANVALAHWICNSVKGTQLPTDAVRARCLEAVA